MHGALVNCICRAPCRPALGQRRSGVALSTRSPPRLRPGAATRSLSLTGGGLGGGVGFVFMPNHIHGILIMDKQDGGNVNANVETLHATPLVTYFPTNSKE
ncbi:MAG: hypothetical protein R2795_26725 [Saprospiraceae bacterium]